MVGASALMPQSPQTAQPQTTPAVQGITAEEQKVETKTVTETQPIDFAKTTANDASLEQGKTAIKTVGVAGVKTLTYQLTFTNGTQTDKKLVKEEVTTPPIAEVTAVGTKPKPAASSNCNPNYSGCVPNASDVDCAGGSGNGPAYVRGPITVIGVDIYDLDRDGDGVACE